MKRRMALGVTTLLLGAIASTAPSFAGKTADPLAVRVQVVRRCGTDLLRQAPGCPTDQVVQVARDGVATTIHYAMAAPGGVQTETSDGEPE